MRTLLYLSIIAILLSCSGRKRKPDAVFVYAKGKSNATRNNTMGNSDVKIVYRSFKTLVNKIGDDIQGIDREVEMSLIPKGGLLVYVPQSFDVVALKVLRGNSVIKSCRVNATFIKYEINCIKKNYAKADLFDNQTCLPSEVAWPKISCKLTRPLKENDTVHIFRQNLKDPVKVFNIKSVL
ncbi:MAG: hypothetical protein OCC49_05745 [Fibrobacterales bacterium]